MPHRLRWGLGAVLLATPVLALTSVPRHTPAAPAPAGTITISKASGRAIGTGAAGTRLASTAAWVEPGYAPTSGDVARALIRRILERDANTEEITSYTAVLDAGTQTVQQLVSANVLGDEYHRRFIEGKDDQTVVAYLYRHLFDREPDPVGLADWAAKGRANGWAWVISALLASPEYGEWVGEHAVPGTPVVYWDSRRAPLILEPATAPVNVERGLCLTLSVPGGASQCGELRMAHTLPGVRTLNQARVPVLTYNNQHANPTPVVAARVMPPPERGTPERVEAVLWVSPVGGQRVVRATRSWNGSSFLPLGQPRRIALAYDASSDAPGAYDHALEVTVFYPGGQSRSWVMRTRKAVVNRAKSPFGAGWWLAGLEELECIGCGGAHVRFLWTGGDGSTRLYRPLAGSPGLWVAPTPERGADTLHQVDDYPGARYMRRLPSGGRVYFSAAGQHIATVNRLDHHTHFGYDSQGRLSTLGVPAGGGYSARRPAYRFEYGPSGISARGRLYRVVAPGLAADAAERVVTVQPQNGDSRIHSFHDPDNTYVEYGYGNPARAGEINRYQSRNRAGAGAFYRFDAAGRLAAAWKDMGESGSADDVSFAITPAETHGLWGEPMLPWEAVAVLDGPRHDVADITRFWLDRFGAPWRIQDALGQETVVTRGDLRFPALPTRVDAPGAEGGRAASTAEYDGLGNLVRSTTINPLGDGRNAVSTMAYEDANWPRQPTRATDAMGVATLTRYDARTGSAIWRQTGQDAAKGVRVTYHPLTAANGPGLVATVRSEAAAQRGEEAERYAYGPSGNPLTTTSPGGVITRYDDDELGRPYLVTSPVGNGEYQTSRTRFDAAGRVAETVTEGPAVAFTRSSHVTGLMTNEVAPAQKLRVRNEYDNDGNLLSVTRWSEPDAAGAGAITTRWEYDFAGRRTKETVKHFNNTEDGRAPTDPSRMEDVSETTVYDKASNITHLYRRGSGQPIVMEYDVMNRMRRRTVPGASYPGESVSVEPGAKTERYRRWAFPLFEPGSSTPNDVHYPRGVAFPEEVSEFDYDGVGNLLSASNPDARVERSYYPGGALRDETQRIREFHGRAFSHVYKLEYGYDLNGRRTELGMPDSLTREVPWMRRTAYGYDPQTGELTRVGGQQYGAGVTYNHEGQVERVLINADQAIVQEQAGYDVEGRVREQARHRNGWLIHHDQFTYDERGKMLRSHTMGDATTNVYSGLGALVWSHTDQYTSEAGTEETYLSDALGNRYQTARIFLHERQELNQRDSTGQHYAPGTGEMLRSGSREEWDRNRTPIHFTVFDRAGNQVRSTGMRINGYPGLQNGAALLHEDTRSYYGTDGKLRVIDRRTCAFGGVPEDGKFATTDITAYVLDCAAPAYDSRAAFEEHRYDALGRRVLTRTTQAWACELYCVNGVTRTVWDGDQIVAEIRAPMGNPERDSGVEANAVPFIDQPLYGRVLYRHGGALDKPLMMVRLDYDQVHTAPQVIVPHTNALGSYDGGTFASTLGGTGPCVKMAVLDNQEVTPVRDPYGNSGGRNDVHTPTRTDTIDHCVEVQWPARYLTRTHQSPHLPTPRSWTGSLILNKRDASGALYMRNRYYDPQTGRFTQQDPIGIAGGLNVYGFGSGDPVNNNDPYGLSDCSTRQPELCRVATLTLGIGLSEKVQKGAGEIEATAAYEQEIDVYWNDVTIGNNDLKFALGLVADGRANIGVECSMRGGSCGVKGEVGTTGNPQGAYRSDGTFGGKVTVSVVVLGVQIHWGNLAKAAGGTSLQNFTILSWASRGLLGRAVSPTRSNTPELYEHPLLDAMMRR